MRLYFILAIRTFRAKGLNQIQHVFSSCAVVHIVDLSFEKFYLCYVADHKTAWAGTADWLELNQVEETDKFNLAHMKNRKTQVALFCFLEVSWIRVE